MVEAHLREVRPGTVEVPASPHHLVGIHLGAPIRATCRVRERVHERLQKHGDTDIVPAGTGGSWRDEAACTVLLLRVEEELVSGQARSLGLEVPMEPKFGVRDRQLEHLAWALHGSDGSENGAGRLYRDSLGVAVAARLLQHYTGLLALPSGGLSAAQRCALEEFVEVNLDQDLSLEQLAGAVELSATRLKSLFKPSFGVTPHQYVLQQRVYRAEFLLRRRRLSVAEVALEVGFAQQSHLAYWMKRLLGVTPSQVRICS